MARTYATPGDLTAYTGQAAPADADQLLTRASQMLDASVLRLATYDTDSAGLPTDTVVAAAVRDATCAQVQWWGLVGDSVGAAGAGWGSVQIGSVSLGRSVTSVSGADSAARQLAPQVWDMLRSPDLAGRLCIGGVLTW